MSYYRNDNDVIQKIIQIRQIVKKYSAKSTLDACLELTCGIINFVDFNQSHGNIILGTPACKIDSTDKYNIIIGYNPQNQVNTTKTSYSLIKNRYIPKYRLKHYKKYDSLKELLGLNSVYPVVPYYKRNQHKYKSSYNYDSYRWESEDIFMKLEQHDEFVQLLFIKRFMEKHTYRSPLAAPLELTHRIFEFIDKSYIPIIIIAKSWNIIRISDGIGNFYC